MAKISVVILSRNEESKIRRLMGSLQPLAAEIVLVDDGSVDGTADIARNEFGVKVFGRPLNGDFSAQRNFGADQAVNDWILAMDADEVLPPETVAAIQDFLRTPGDASAALLSRLNHLCGQPLNYGGRDKDHLRLYRKSRARFTGMVHERLEFSGSPVRIRADVWHYPAESVDALIRKGLGYTEHDARRYVSERAEIPVKEVRFRLTWRPVKVFWKLYSTLH